jgi:hypothetical protein
MMNYPLTPEKPLKGKTPIGRAGAVHLVQDFINTLTSYIAPLTPTLSPRIGVRGK